MNARDRLAVYLVGQFVAVTVLATLVGAMLGRFPFGGPLTRPVATTIPTWLAMRTLEAVGVLVLLGYVGAIAAVLLGGRSLVGRARYRSAVAITTLSLPCLVLLLVAGWVVVGARLGQLLAVTALVGGVGLLALVVAVTLGLLGGDRSGDAGVGDRSDDRSAGSGDGSGRDTAPLVVAALVCLGVLVGVVGVAGGADALVEERDRFGVPQAAFETTYEPVNETHGVLTVRHDGGDAIPRTELYVRGRASRPSTASTRPRRGRGPETRAGRTPVRGSDRTTRRPSASVPTARSTSSTSAPGTTPRRRRSTPTTVRPARTERPPGIGQSTNSTPVTSKQTPPSTPSVTATVQPWAVAISRTMARPNPVPSRSVV